MYYDRQIKYLDYMEKGERCKGAGFVKIEVRGSECNLSVKLNGLRSMDSYTKELLISDGKREAELSRIVIEQGKGTLQLRLNSENMGETGIGYEQLTDIRIPLAAEREVRCIWRVGSANKADEREKKAEVRQKQADVREKQTAEMEGQRGDRQEETAKPRCDRMPQVEVCDEKEQAHASAISHEASDLTEDAVTNFPRGNRQNREVMKDVKKQPIKLQENKWKQLNSIYPHISPFHDDREYLSIGPADFVILSEKQYRSLNNSFLLHGYYNYEHLILTRVEQRGEIQYYIGVPGNFYDREKQVAIMFGFESFECKEEPAKAGDFGYYMMRTEL